jgi:hypothetical protein
MYRVLLAAFNASIRRATLDFSLLVDSIEFREIGGVDVSTHGRWWKR